MSRLLITGGSGFIGKRLSRHLVGAGHEVVHFVRRDGSQDVEFPAVVTRDFSRDAIRSSLADVSVDGVIHLAAAGVHPQDRDPLRIFDTNVGATQALIEAAAQAGAHVFIHAGSSAEYSDTAVAPFGPQSPLQGHRLYGASKAAGSLLAASLGPHLGLSTVILRLFNVYGPGEAPHRLLPSLVKALLNGDNVPLSAGTQERDFIHVDDVCVAFERALENAAANSGAIVDVCTGVPTTVRAFAEAVADVIGVDRSHLSFGALPLRPDDIAQVVGDPARMRELLDFAEPRSMRQGVHDAIAAMRR